MGLLHRRKKGDPEFFGLHSRDREKKLLFRSISMAARGPHFLRNETEEGSSLSSSLSFSIGDGEKAIKGAWLAHISLISFRQSGGNGVILWLFAIFFIRYKEGGGG